MEQQNTDLKQFIAAFTKWWWLILVSVVVAGAVSYLAAQSQPKQYLSSTTLLVGQGTRNPNTNAGDLSISQALAQSYADIATREPVMVGTLNALNLPWDVGSLRNKVTARVVQGTQLIEVGVVDTDPERAKVLADTVANQLILQSPKRPRDPRGAEPPERAARANESLARHAGRFVAATAIWRGQLALGD